MAILSGSSSIQVYSSDFRGDMNILQFPNIITPHPMDPTWMIIPVSK